MRAAAIIELMRESMVRTDELLSMRTEDVDIKGRKALVRRRKGGRARLVAFSVSTARRLDRYTRGLAVVQGGLGVVLAALTEDTAGPAGVCRAVLGAPQAWRAARPRPWHRREEPAEHAAPAHAARHGRDRVERQGRLHILAAAPGRLDIADTAARYVKAAEQQLAVEEAHRLFDSR